MWLLINIVNCVIFRGISNYKKKLNESQTFPVFLELKHKENSIHEQI